MRERDGMSEKHKLSKRPLTSFRYQCARPQLFRVGDIVEIQCSVIFVKARGTKHRMKLVLRSIALLDCEIALVSSILCKSPNRIPTDWQDAKRKTVKASVQEEPSIRCLKRKVGYEDNEDEKEKKCIHMDQSSDWSRKSRYVVYYNWWCMDNENRERIENKKWGSWHGKEIMPAILATKRPNKRNR